jgi:hypothetical protein
MMLRPLSISAIQWRNNWSGKEDSNLRPLPPENASPAVMRRFSVASSARDMPFRGVCSRFISQRGSLRTHNPCLLNFPRAAIGSGAGLGAAVFWPLYWSWEAFSHD